MSGSRASMPPTSGFTHTSSPETLGSTSMPPIFGSTETDGNLGPLFRLLDKKIWQENLDQIALDLVENVYAKLNESKLKLASEEHVKLIEIAIEVGTLDDVHIIELVEDARPKLHLEPYYSKDGKRLIIAASDLLIAAGPNHDTLLHIVAFHGNSAALDKLLSAFFSPAAVASPTPPSPQLAGSFSPAAASPTPPSPQLDVDPPNKEGRTPLHYASGKGHIDVARMLLNEGAKKDAKDAYGVLPFHFAARSGNTQLLEMLQVEAVDELATGVGMTALHYAAWNGRREAVEWLLAHGASADVTDAVRGNTPLHLAASRNIQSLGVIHSLIKVGGADAQILNKDGEWPIGLADKGGNHELAKAIMGAIRQSASIRMGVHKLMKMALLTKQQRSNGATLFHFFAAYGTPKDLEWFLALLQENVQDNKASESHDRPLITLNPTDNDGRTVAHWAARLSNTDALRVLAENKVDLHAAITIEPSDRRKTPLSIAVLKGDMEFADELLKLKPLTDQASLISDTKKWLEDYYRQKINEDAKFRIKFQTLQDGFQRYTRQILKVPKETSDLFSEMPPIYLALYAERTDIAIFLQGKSTKGEAYAVNMKEGYIGWTALHWATFLRQKTIVSTLCQSKDLAPFLTPNEEDALGRTALQYTKQMGLGDIENELMQRSDIKVYVGGMYKDRQLYVDATNAILVGAALIASVTFVGWLQPPLNYTPYYNLPQPPPPSPPDIFQSYAAIQQNMGVRSFWILNSLSFTMAICTMLAGLVGVAPIPGVFIAMSVRHLQRCLVIASAFLGISIMFVLGAFAAAGCAVLPPLFEYQVYMMATMIVGGLPCLVLLIWFAGRLWSFRCVRRQYAEDFKSSTSTAGVEEQPKNEIEERKRSKDLVTCVGPRYHIRPWDDGLDGVQNVSPIF